MSNTDNIIEELSFKVKDVPYDYLLTKAVGRMVQSLQSENKNLKQQRDEMLSVLEEVAEALYCASDWEVPIMLQTRVKEVIAKAKGE